MIVSDVTPGPRWVNACELPSSCEKCKVEQGPTRSRHLTIADLHRKGHKADRFRNSALNDPESLSVSSQSSVRFVILGHLTKPRAHKAWLNCERFSKESNTFTIANGAHWPFGTFAVT